MNRKEILKKIAEEQVKIVENLQESVARYRTASDMDEDDTSDPDDYARQTEAKDMQLRFEQMLAAAKQNLAFIEAESKQPHTLAEEGAIVETGDHFFFLGSNVPHFTYDGKDVYCVTRETPVYKSIVGKNVGDEIQVGNQKAEITHIF